MVPVFSSLEVQYELCTGCRSCEAACSLAKEGNVYPAASRVQVKRVYPGPLDIPVICRQCRSKPCVEACPPRAKALSIEQQTGVVIVDASKCLGLKCRRCLRNCPHGAVVFHPVEEVPLFCDLCSGEPSCVTACPTSALSSIPASLFDGAHYARFSAEEVGSRLWRRLYPGNVK